MINVKDQVFASIQNVCPDATDIYPSSWVDFPAVQYTEEENKVYEWTDNEEESAYIRYRIDIWDKGSTSKTALAIDKEISKLGLRRTTCQDVADPSGLRHKMMRYEGIINVNTEFVTQENL